MVMGKSQSRGVCFVGKRKERFEMSVPFKVAELSCSKSAGMVIVIARRNRGLVFLIWRRRLGFM